MGPVGPLEAHSLFHWAIGGPVVPMGGTQRPWALETMGPIGSEPAAGHRPAGGGRRRASGEGPRPASGTLFEQ